MRSSDWRSDVCSSELVQRHPEPAAVRHPRRRRGASAAGRRCRRGARGRHGHDRDPLGRPPDSRGRDRGRMARRVPAPHREPAEHPHLNQPAPTYRGAPVPTIRSINPATGAEIGVFEEDDDSTVEAKLAAASEAVAALATAGWEARATWMRAAADLMDAEAEDVAAAITAEMGKPIAQARQEVAKSARAMRFYADHAEGRSEARRGGK